MMSAFVSGSGLMTTRRGRLQVAPRVRMQERHFVEGLEVKGFPQAVRNYVTVKPAEAEEITGGGLILATTAVEKPNYGEVVNVGSGYRYRTTGEAVPMVVSEGDCVIYGTYGFETVDIDDDEYVFVSQDAVLAKVEGEYKAENVRPIYDTVFIRRDPKTEQKGSIVLSSGAQEKPNTGTILAMGPGRLMESGQTEPAPYSVGDRVFITSSAGTSVKFEGAEHVLVRVIEILAKVEGEE